jgi:thiol:disulfide interchange protein
MKHILSLFLILLSFHGLSAQIVKPVKWVQHLEKISVNEFNVVMEAQIDNNWHMYSQFTPDGGSSPMTIDYKNQKDNYQLIGKTTESSTKRLYNDIFNVDEIFWEQKAVLTQRIKIINPKFLQIDAIIDYQVCKDVCMNDQAKFTFKLPPIIAREISAAPSTKTFVKANVTSDTSAVTSPVISTNVSRESEKNNKPATETAKKQQPTQKLGFWTIFFLAFGAGFTALLTPCVFPMIPMTVSFFTKQSKNKATGIRNAIFYGIAIILIYVLLGLLITGIFGAGALNAIATNVWFNVIFFILLVVFAISFMGAFEIILPNSWANKVDRQADRGGLLGILFMALALAIVSFSCTGIFIGNLLVVAAREGGIAPIIGMLGFSLALALPFMLFAIFPGWMTSLPRSGGWLNTVKVFLGFLELALAFKFLSNADLVLQLHLLEREEFLAIWIAIFGALTLYLFGKFQTPHDSPVLNLSVGRILVGLLTLSFTIYLIPGLWGAPLKLISAFPPPIHYSESPMGVGSSTGIETPELPSGSTFEHGMIVFNDYQTGLAYAKLVHKSVMLDFTGHACVNCRKMENNVWSDPEVYRIMKNDLVLISLYVDDKRELPKNEKYTTPEGEQIVTIGDKWTNMTITRYNTNTQPLYVLLDSNGKDISPTISYTSKDEYLDWLKKALKN